MNKSAIREIAEYIGLGILCIPLMFVAYVAVVFLFCVVVASCSIPSIGR